MNNDIILATPGYHVNDKERCLQFINEEDCLIISHDKYWLGCGMYFWDNKNNAKYWLKEKKRKDPDKTYIVVLVNILNDEESVLDLSNREVENEMNELWKVYCEKKGENFKQPLGIKIDKLFNFFDELDKIKVIKGIGDYNIKNKKTHKFVYNDSNNSRPQIKTDLRVIYCVRKVDAIINRKKMEA